MEILKIIQYFVLISGAIAQITHYLERVSGSNVTDGDALRISEEFLEEIWDTSLIGNWVDDGVNASGGRVYRFTPSAEPVSIAIGDISPTCATGAVGDALPQQIACRIVTGSTGRNRPGSVYLPGQTVQALLSTGLYNSTFTAAALSYAGLLQSDYSDLTTGTSWRPRKFSLKDAMMINIQGDISVNDVPDTQRRRKPGVGT